MDGNTKVVDILKNTTNTHFSFEILPPLKGRNIQNIYEAIDPLMPFNPININVTYHQEETVYKRHKSGLLERKTVWKRPGTVAISAAIKYKYPSVTVVPHLICGGFTKEETENALIDLHFLGMKNILALRGDPPKSQRYFTPEEGGHEHTLGLIKQIMDLNNGNYLDDELRNTQATDFSVGIAGYPEKHAEAPNLERDLQYLKAKVDAGADYIVTQMFFINQHFFDFVAKCRGIGITVPIVPGIKPLITSNDIKMLPRVFNIDIPNELVLEVQNCENEEQVKQLGIEWAIMQSRELIKFGVPALHYFTISNPDSIKKIVEAVF